ncbi:MAG: hypothetical protein QNL17_07030 [Synechococcus sp. ChSW.bin.154]
MVNAPRSSGALPLLLGHTSTIRTMVVSTNPRQEIAVYRAGVEATGL